MFGRTFILPQHLLCWWLNWSVMLQCRSVLGALCKLLSWLTQGNNNVGTKFSPRMGTLLQLWGNLDLNSIPGWALCSTYEEMGFKFNPRKGNLLQLWGSWGLTISDLSMYVSVHVHFDQKQKFLSAAKTTFYGSQGERYKRITGQTNLVWESNVPSQLPLRFMDSPQSYPSFF